MKYYTEHVSIIKLEKVNTSYYVIFDTSRFVLASGSNVIIRCSSIYSVYRYWICTIPRGLIISIILVNQLLWFSYSLGLRKYGPILRVNQIEEFPNGLSQENACDIKVNLSDFSLSLFFVLPMHKLYLLVTNLDPFIEGKATVSSGITWK